MRKRTFSLLLALVMSLSVLLTPAFAKSVFPDITDAATTRNVEVLRLMGVIDGDGSGNFRPNGTLTRAEFCKMVVVLMGNASEVERYKTVTIFPDVRAKHWAAGYINYAVRGGTRLIAGLPDGTFCPDKAITYGEAITILMRLLGYSDADSGGVWPKGYLALAEASGLTEGLSLSGSATITRAQAAQLFVRLLLTENKGGGQYAQSAYTMGAETTLVSLSGTTMRTADGQSYTTMRASSGSDLAGLKGYVLCNKEGKAVTFLPKAITRTAGAADAAVIIAANGSTAGVSALTGGQSNYEIYRNGVRIEESGLKKNDVAIYDASANVLLVCDTRLTAYYESCEPSVTAPTIVKVFGGTSFNVLPSAQDSVAQFKPGRVITLLLTADGQIASAAGTDSGLSGNAFALADANGNLQLICGTQLVDLAAKVSGSSCGKVGRISSLSKESVNFTVQSSSLSGEIDVAAGTLGGNKIADHALIVDDGKLVALSSLTAEKLKASSVTYARLASNGEVDLIVLGVGASGTVYYGRAIVTESAGYDWSGSEYTEVHLQVAHGSGQSSPSGLSGFGGKTGQYVEATYKNGRYTSVNVLSAIENLSKNAWVGTSALNYNGRTYPVSSAVVCYNRDSGVWMDSLEQAIAYNGRMDAYISEDGVVRVVEIHG